MSSPSSFAPSLAQLRKLLNAVLVSESDLDAFCTDHFPEVKSQFSNKMNRVDKANVLLDHNHGDTGKIVAELRLFRPAAVTKHEHLLYEDTPRARATRARSEKLAALQTRREQDTLAGKDTSELQPQINTLRHELRRHPQLNAGEVIANRYVLSVKIGQGGFGDVWKAYDREANGPVAIKALHGQYNDDKNRVTRFKRGAKKMKSLRHPYIVGVLQDPDIHDNFHYYVMEYVPKGDLFEAVKRKTISTAQSTQVILQAGEALSHAHKKNLVHRDIKPHNILLSQDQEARITDFDLVADKYSELGETRTGDGMGTIYYSAPEQRADATKADQRSDIYSLGMCLAFTVHGKSLPTDLERNFEAFLQQLDCSESLRNLIRKAAAWYPKDRHPTMDDFCQELRQAANLGPPSSGLAPPRNETRRNFFARLRSRRPSLTLSLGAAALGISVGGGILIKNLLHRPTPSVIAKPDDPPVISPRPIPNTPVGPTGATSPTAPPAITPAGPKTEPPPTKPPEAPGAATLAAIKPSQPDLQAAARRNWINGKPPAPSISRSDAFAKIQEGRQQIDNGRSDLGYLQCYAATGDPQVRGPALTCMGEAEFGRGRYNEAIKLGKLALKERGSGRDTFLLLGKTYVKLKNCKEARPIFLRVLNVSSGNPEALAGLERCPP